MELLEKVKSVMIGHAVGDALGVPVEFMSREELKENPVIGMRGYGTYPMPKGSWSDDTSMALCALDTFGEGKLNFDKVMLNFARWYYEDLFTPTGEMFDVGNTCSFAIVSLSCGNNKIVSDKVNTFYATCNPTLNRHGFISP